MNTDAKIQKILLPPLILITPFLVFLDYNSYCLTCAETWIAIGGLIVLGVVCSVLMLVSGWKTSAIMTALLIPVFIDLQLIPRNSTGWAPELAAFLLFCGMQTFVLCLFLKDKFHIIATAVFATFFVVTVFQLFSPFKHIDSLFHQLETGTDSAPRIIHLILDEHIGIDGIPTDIEGGIRIKHFISQFYLKNGFRLYGGAYSRYFYSHTSLANMFNFGNGNNAAGLIKGHGPYNLVQNEYFRLLSENQYQIAVISPEWVRLCNSTVFIASCIKKDWGTLVNFKKLELSNFQKLQVLYGRYVGQSRIATALIYSSALILQGLLPALTTSIAEWTWPLDSERTRIDPLNTLADLKPLWNSLVLLPHGTALIAHLLIPHYPYVALSDCSIRQPNKTFLWKNWGLLNPPPTNTMASRKERYLQYFEQLECLYLKLDELLTQLRTAGIYDDTIIVIHGDHGSRIVMTEPTVKNRHALTNRDLLDGFSTLFAVKIPGKPGGYNHSPRPLEQLFAQFAYEAGLTPVKLLPERIEPYVYLTGESDEELIRAPYVPHN